MIRRLLVDTGVWYAMFARRDGHRDRVVSIVDNIERANTLIVPWPTMYETLRTRFVKDDEGLTSFVEYIDHANIDFIDSRPYDEQALSSTRDWAFNKKRPMSMVDCLIRQVIEDRNAAVDALATLDHRDFQDVCAQYGVVLL